MTNQNGQSNVIAVITMIIVAVALAVILYGASTGLLFTSQSTIGQVTKGATGDLATCRIESANSSTNTISIRETNNVSGVSVDSIYITSGSNPGSYSCTGPDLTYGNVSDANSTLCTGLSFEKGDAIKIAGTHNLSCTAAAR